MLEDTRKPESEIRITEVLNITGNIQRNIDNLEAWMQPAEVTPLMNPADRATIVGQGRAGCAGHCQAVQGRTRDQDGVRPEREGLEHVGSPRDATIHQQR